MIKPQRKCFPNRKKTMRGPLVRIKYDIRRHWKCPKCGYERRAHATKTAIRCHCEKDGPFMKLVESQRQIRPPTEELDNYIEYEEADETENDSTIDNSAVSTTEELTPANEEQITTTEDVVSQETEDAVEDADEQIRADASSSEAKSQDSSPNAS